MTEAGLSLGANLGDRFANLRDAAARIAAIPGVFEIARARVYETTPVGVQPQYRHLAYLNTVLIIRTSLPAPALSDRLHAIEAAMGRVRTTDRFAPRTMDIDILYVGDEVRDDSDLTLPHPRWAARRFVLQPLADVRPGLRIPGSRETVGAMLTGLPGEPDVVCVAEVW